MVESGCDTVCAEHATNPTKTKANDLSIVLKINVRFS
jgi:hypothetical protein